MTDDLRPTVSVNTENTDLKAEAISNFAAAFGWGALAGFVGLFASIFLISGPDLSEANWQDGIFFVALFVSLFTLAGMLVIGLPVTLILRAVGLEHIALYCALGAGAGFASLALLFEVPNALDPETVFIPLVGAIAGFVSALRWGRWRERRARGRRLQREAHAPERPTNPIHDLLH